ncbi:MAG: glycosyltransferase, partial [Bacteroidota bacterium]
MFDNVLRVLTPNYQKLSWQNVLLVLVLVTLFIRFPFFFRDYVDRDESTFIIMGQSWVNGHLPYTHLWDLKPPITFLFFASIITIFGKSFIAIRLFGALLVALT